MKGRGRPREDTLDYGGGYSGVVNSTRGTPYRVRCGGTRGSLLTTTHPSSCFLLRTTTGILQISTAELMTSTKAHNQVYDL